jgi:hypothetical protein
MKNFRIISDMSRNNEIDSGNVALKDMKTGSIKEVRISALSVEVKAN